MQGTIKDRDYYRALTNRELVDEVKRAVDIAWQEIAVVLAERVEDNTMDTDWTCERCSYDNYHYRR